MRKLVAVIILLIAAKFGYHEYLYRVATREVIVGTFQERALQSCQKHTRANAVTQSGTAPSSAWTKPASIALMVGKSGLDVQLWQINSAKWNARYRNPYLLIVADSSASGMACEYDIISGTAQVYRL